jgi:hypothetical protein
MMIIKSYNSNLKVLTNRIYGKMNFNLLFEFIIDIRQKHEKNIGKSKRYANDLDRGIWLKIF